MAALLRRVLSAIQGAGNTAFYWSYYGSGGLTKIGTVTLSFGSRAQHCHTYTGLTTVKAGRGRP